MIITKTPREFIIDFKFRPYLVDAIKAHFPVRNFNYIHKTWAVPLSAADLVASFAKQYNFTFGEPETEQEFIINELPDLDVKIPLKMNLFPYQRSGVAYSLTKKKLIVGDQMGLGKTAQAIATITAANAFPCLIICPSSLKINWQREWEQWTDKRARILDTAIARYMGKWVESGAIQVFIVNYESLKKYFVEKIEKPEGERLTLRHIKFNGLKEHFKSVIIDECHRTKDARSQQSKYTKRICESKEYVLALTGTPVINKPKDLVSQLSIIGRLQDFGGYTGFINRYCAGVKEASNLKELNWKLRNNCFYRREKEDVMPDLPAKMRQVFMCEIDPVIRKEYETAMEDLEKYLTDYRQATDDKIASALRGEVMVRIGILKNISARGKLADVREYVQETIDNGEKLVVFFHLTEIYEKLSGWFLHAVSIRGADSMEDRQRNIDNFQNNPECKLILCSVKAAGVGITLTASSRVAFVELGWHPAEMDQAEDRCHRIGQKDSVQCTYFLGKETIDEWIYQVISDKRAMSDEITGAKNNVVVNVVDSIIQLIK